MFAGAWYKGEPAAVAAAVSPGISHLSEKRMELDRDPRATLSRRAARRVLGAPRDLRDPHMFHKLSLIPLLAWVGLGADGLSSSAYGPEEAYRALGDHTYTGIEAVSNGLQIMRDPKVRTGKRTMLYMAISLAVTASGLFVCYLLLEVRPVAGKTLNSVLADSLFGAWPFGHAVAVLTILSEGALLLVAAQAGFIDAPRVMANMAVDSRLPHGFAWLSDRLTMRNGIVMIGAAALALLLYTRGSISALVVMYSINVFATFSLPQSAMARFFVKNRYQQARWRKNLAIHATGLIPCLTILSITLVEKFREGGWLTVPREVSVMRSTPPGRGESEAE